MGYFEDMLENTEEHALFLEIYLEEWPELLQFSESELNTLYNALSATLQRLDCPAQGMKAIGDHLYLVLQMSVDCSVDQIINALENTSKICLRERTDNLGPQSYSAYTLSAIDVIDAVVLLHRPVEN